MNLLSLALAGIIAYLLGSIPFGVIFGHLFKGVGVRSGGSKHMGALNTWRMVGLFPAVLVAFGDMGKALVAINIAQALDPTGSTMPVAGAMAVVGHCWPIYVGFRGGVGIASGMAMIFYLAPLAALVMVAIWGVWGGHPPPLPPLPGGHRPYCASRALGLQQPAPTTAPRHPGRRSDIRASYT